MPAKPSGQVKTSIIHEPQKNGDIYVYERETIYLPEKRYNKVLRSKLIGKIPFGKTEMVPTRPKRPAGSKEKKENDSNKNLIVGKRHNIGMMHILDHIGKESGVDDSLYSSTDIGTAQKILSIARYYVATGGQPTPGIVTWQLNHKIPYASGISEDIYHDLYEEIGRDESLFQNFFLSRRNKLSDNALIAYDSTTLSTYSDQQLFARYGYNKDNDGLKTIKIMTLYSVDINEPIAFSKQPGNIPDVSTLDNAMREISFLGLNTGEFILDNGYYSIANLAELIHRGYDFTILIKNNISWVRSTIECNINKLKSSANVCPFDPLVKGLAVPINHIFIRDNKYLTKEERERGEGRAFKKRVFLHLYYNIYRQADETASFDLSLNEMRLKLESKEWKMDNLDEKILKKINKYLNVTDDGEKVTVKIKDFICDEEYKYHGIFVLFSNKEKSPFECLRKYRQRNMIETFFRAEKNTVDGKRPRSWTDTVLRGRLFVQFIALCYYQYLKNKLNEIENSLGKRNGDPEHDTKAILSKEEKLRSWIKNMTITQQLQWFDAIEGVEVSSEITRKRWNTDAIAQDELYLQKLGVTLPAKE